MPRRRSSPRPVETKTGAARAAALSCVLLAAVNLSAPAGAQSEPKANVSPPAEAYAVSPGGVDMRSGRYAYSQTDLAIGGEGGALALTRTLSQPVLEHANPFANFSHNWDILISEKRINVQQGIFRHTIGQPDYQIEVSFGGRSQTFRSEGPNAGFEQIARSGFASLTVAGSKAASGAVYTFRTGDGTEAVFRAIGSGDCSVTLRCAYVAQVTEADGTRLSFDYDNPGGNATRLRAVTSSRGYALLLEYSGSQIVKACVLNLALAPKPASNVCPGGVPTATYSYGTAGGQTRLATAIDPSGAVWSFVNGANTIGFVRPGEAGPWLTNTILYRGNDDGLVEEIVSSQSFADASSYGYAYDETPPVTGQVASLAGGAYTDNLGRTTTLRYDFPVRPYDPAQGHGTVEGESGGTSLIVLQTTPGPVEVTDPLGRVTLIDYCDPAAMAGYPPSWTARCMVSPGPVSTTNPGGIQVRMTWDNSTRTLLQTRQIAAPGSLQPNGQPWEPIVRRSTYNCTPATFRYCSKPVTDTDANEHVTNYAYSTDHGGLLSVTLPAPAEGAPRPQTRHEYAQRHAWISNGAGGFVQAAAPVWLRTATSACRTSAATGNPAAPCATAGDEVRTAYDYGPDSGPNTLLLRGQTVNADGATLRTCYTYDVQGRRISETQPNANPASCPAALAGASAFTGAVRYDAMGRVTGTISADPDGVGTGNPFLAVRTTYDGAGRATKVETGQLSDWQSESTAPIGWAGFTADRTAETQYDAMGRKIREWMREGSVGPVRTMTEYSYDAIGRPACTAVRMNPAAFAFSGAANACTPNAQGTAPNDFGPDRISRNVYDAAGQRVQLRVGVGSGTEAADATWAYNLNGQVTTMIDGNGNRAGLFYDGHGRQNCWMFPSATRPAAYDDATQATALASAGSLNGGMTGGHCTSGDYEAYGYDPNGNRTDLRKRDERHIALAYDALNRVTAKTYPQGGAVPVHYGYDLRNLQLSARFDSQAGAGITNAFDGFGRLASSSTNLGGVTRTLAYHYDRDGNRIQITHPDGAWFGTLRDGLGRPYWLYSADPAAGIYYSSYRPDGLPAGQSRSNGASTWTARDAVGRLNGLGHYYGGGGPADVLWLFAHNPASQIASLNRDNDGYAWTGHYAVSRAYTTNGLNQYSGVGDRQYLYDLNGNLTSDGTRTYLYDVENRMVSGNGATLAYDPLGRLYQVTLGAATTRFLYDGDALVAEYDGAGAMTRRYVHWDGADVPIMSYANAALTSPSYLHPDHQGSIVALSGPAGTPVTINRYDEYGIPGAANAGRFQYTGQVWLAELGMYHYKARIYSPTLGRFMQTDPIGYEGGIYLYAYVNGDPINNVDPDGRDAIMLRGRDGSRTLIIPVQITVMGGTPQEQAATRAAIVARANSVQTDDSSMRVLVVATNTRIDGVLNHLTFASGYDWKMCPPNGECTSILGGRAIHINSDNNEAVAGAAHDIFHLAGIEDGFREDPRDASGNRVITPRPGYTDQDIMLRRIGTKLPRSQFDQAERNPTTRQLCEGSRGQHVRCPR
jgi:RHS repeat-associated protein